LVQCAVTPHSRYPSTSVHTTMLIFSWNVAGWSQTIKRIDTDYPATTSSTSSSSPTPSAYAVTTESSLPGSSVASSSSFSSAAAASAASTGTGGTTGTTSSKAKRLPRSQSIANYFARHNADIICIQEAKIPLSQLSSRSEPLGCSSIPGYESFWCPNTCADASKRGFNGVVTYAKVGTVQSADCRPLGSPDLDDQGRCVMTNHGKFVLFNVYVPAGGSNPLSYKMKFLNALRRAMQRQRKAGKHVILSGDLNIAHRRDDVHWKYRVVDVDAVVQEVRRARETGYGSSTLPQWKLELCDHWDLINAALSTKEVIPVTTKNTKTGQEFAKFRLRVAVTGDSSNRYVILGKAEPSQEEALWYYDFSGATYFDEDQEEELPSRKANCIGLDTLMELMSKIARVEWDDRTRKLIANTSANVKHASPTIRWLDNIINEDGMVDSFRHFYPTAKDRFTCWHQYTNKRFENEGCRIDYMLVDEPLLEHIQRGPDDPLRCCRFDGNPICEEAALHAATASGSFKGSSFEGGGIALASQHALDTQFGGAAHTGVIYTPPSYSDHIATSLLLNDLFVEPSLHLDETDAATKRAQPHKKQKSIASFFGKKPAGGLLSKPSTGLAKAANAENSLQRQASDNGKRKGQQSLASTFKRTKSVGSRSSITEPKQKQQSTKPTGSHGSIMNHFVKRSNK